MRPVLSCQDTFLKEIFISEGYPHIHASPMLTKLGWSSTVIKQHQHQHTKDNKDERTGPQQKPHKFHLPSSTIDHDGGTSQDIQTGLI